MGFMAHEQNMQVSAEFLIILTQQNSKLLGCTCEQFMRIIITIFFNLVVSSLILILKWHRIDIDIADAVAESVNDWSSVEEIMGSNPG